MKKLILLSATLLLMLFANAQIVNIPDANFKAALLADTLINTNQDGEIQVSEALATDTIDVYSMNIADLTGIEAFTALIYLNCGSNQLTSLDITNNIALIYLTCYQNQLTSLDISNNITLESLSCFSNQINILDVSNNSSLISLTCLSNPLGTLDVSNNTALEFLYCQINQLTSLDVSNNTSLTNLSCWENQLSTLDVSNNTALIGLWCSGNQLSSLNVKNGNNTVLTDFYTVNSPILFCIEVDDPVWSTTNWTDIDPQSYFSNDCNYVSVPNQLQTQELKLAPNPFNEKLSVLLPDNTNADNIEIALYNVLGKQIKVSTEKANNEIIINGANLHSGIYFVEITTNKHTITKRIIKQ